METLYTGHIHGFPSGQSKTDAGASTSIWDEQSGLVALGVVLGSSVSLVGLAFAFITYSLFSDLRSLAGTALLSFLASLFMGQLFFVIGVGGIQDTDLCLSLSMAQMFMKLASLAWLCCCCHHALTVFRSSTNLMPVPETHMGKSLAHYSILSWGFPLLMVAVALAFKYSTVEDYNVVGGGDGHPVLPTLTHVEIVHAAASTVGAKKTTSTGVTTAHNAAATNSHVNGQHQSRHNISSVSYAERHCWLMEGPAYLWGFLIPGSVLLLLGLWLALQASDAVKLAASLQVDSRTRNKLLKRRGLQIGLFIKLLILLAFVLVLGAMASLWALPELWAIYSIIQGAQGILTAFLVTCNCRVLKLYTVPRHKQQQQKYVMNKGCYKSLRDCEKGQYGVLSITNPNYDASAVDDRLGAAMSDDDEEVDIFKCDSLGRGEVPVQHPLQIWSAAASSQEVIREISNGGSTLGGGGVSGTQVVEPVIGGSRECDKSFRTGTNATSKVERAKPTTKEHRILTSRMMIKTNEDNEGGVSGGDTYATSVTAGGGAAAAAASETSPDEDFLGQNNKKSIQSPVPSSLPSNGKLSGALSIAELPRRPLPSAV